MPGGTGCSPPLTLPCFVSEPAFALPQIVIDTLERHVGEPTAHESAWTTDRGGFLRRGTLGRTWLEGVAQPIGTPRQIHDLRHTHAAWLIAACEHPKSTQTRLGHSSIQVTVDRYGHLMDGLDRQTAARLDAIAGTVHVPGVSQNPPGLSL